MIIFYLSTNNLNCHVISICPGSPGHFLAGGEALDAHVPDDLRPFVIRLVQHGAGRQRRPAGRQARQAPRPLVPGGRLTTSSPMSAVPIGGNRGTVAGRECLATW